MENLLLLLEDTDVSVTTESLLCRLTKSRLQKALRYKNESDRRMCAFGEILVFYALRTVGAAQTDVIWDGKPRPADGAYHFSLSHTKDQIALFVSDTPCGIDIELPCKLRQKDALTQRLFGEGERVTIKNEKDLFRIWTAKESFVKYTGEGFSRPFSSFYADLDMGAVHDALTNEKLACIAPFTAFEDTLGCICTKGPISYTTIQLKAKEALM